MAVLTVGQLIETLNNHYSPDATLVVTWWDKSDVSDMIADIYYDGEIPEPSDEQVTEVWNSVSDSFSNIISDQLAWCNDDLFDIVQRRFKAQVSK